MRRFLLYSVKCRGKCPGYGYSYCIWTTKTFAYRSLACDAAKSRKGKTHNANEGGY